jgi:hypothetical protein
MPSKDWKPHGAMWHGKRCARERSGQLLREVRLLCHVRREGSRRAAVDPGGDRAEITASELGEAALVYVKELAHLSRGCSRE